MTGCSYSTLGHVLWSDPVCCGCNQSQCTQFRWNESDMTRWNQMRLWMLH